MGLRLLIISTALGSSWLGGTATENWIFFLPLGSICGLFCERLECSPCGAPELILTACHFLEVFLLSVSHPELFTSCSSAPYLSLLLAIPPLSLHSRIHCIVFPCTTLTLLTPLSSLDDLGTSLCPIPVCLLSPPLVTSLYRKCIS